MVVNCNTNISSIMLQRNLYSVTKSLNKSLERLSTGSKINIAADNAAGLIISEAFKSQKNGANVSIQNSQSGINMLQTAEGCLQGIENDLQRIRELAVQASNGINGAAEREAIKKEIVALKDNINQSSEAATFNDIALFKDRVSEVDSQAAFADENMPAANADVRCSVEYNGKLYAFGFANDSCYSYDGTNWVKENMPAGASGVEKPGTAAVYNGKLYAFGWGGSDNCYSYDGSNWTKEDMPGSAGGVDGPSESVVYDGKLYVFGNSNDYEGYCFDGSNWTDLNLPAAVQTPSDTFTYDGKLYVLGGSSNNCYSWDGSTWTNANLPAGVIGPTSGVEYNGKLYVFGYNNDSCYSFNGTDWTQESMPAGASGVDGPEFSKVYNGKLYAFGANNDSCYSFNGTDWVKESMPAGASGVDNPGSPVEYDDKLFIFGRNNNKCFSLSSENNASDTRLQVGANGDDYSDINMGTNGSLDSIDFGDITGIDNIDSFFTATGFDRTFINQIDNGLKSVSRRLSDIGSTQNRLESVINSLSSSSEHLSGSMSTIVDTDIANEASELVKKQILQQTTASLLAQANQAPSIALSLI